MFNQESLRLLEHIQAIQELAEQIRAVAKMAKRKGRETVSYSLLSYWA